MPYNLTFIISAAVSFSDFLIGLAKIISCKNVIELDF